YGRKFKSTPITLNLKEFNKKVLQSEAGHNLIFSLKLSADGKLKPVPVITHNVQRNPLTDEIIHLDLMHIIMDEIIKTKVPVEFKGIPIGVKEEGGVLVQGLREIELKCLPGDIPDKFEIDVSTLAINQSLYVSDLSVSKKVEILADKADMVATVSPPTKEEVVAPPPLTPEEAAAAAAAAEGEGAVAEEGVKEKAPPGAAPAAEKAKPAEGEKKEKREKK
ncbi:MAG: 50S ribosomal protein L25, partial [Candidatus Saganbacteria bacterium]|nr:50S ribosomal protein L25 [Candidatus Saganbacteria bacterium]